jgi:hypothetical protein
VVCSSSFLFPFLFISFFILMAITPVSKEKIMKVKVSFRSEGKRILIRPKRTFANIKEAQQWVLDELIENRGLTYTKSPRNWMHGNTKLTYWGFIVSRETH